ncbi:MAG: HRDC domain-containing protein [Succinivibrio sp.]|nr:HRDC domain-containing protein [Succinivibrio sp.]
MSLNYTLIEQEDELLELASALKNALPSEFISLDTEFERERTLRPRLALVQLKFRGQCYLIDPLALPDLRPLIETICSLKAALLVFSGEEDLELICALARDYELERLLPGQIIDVQLLAGFAGLYYNRGLQFSLQETLHIAIQKDQTRSDWLHRPLDLAQLDYAVLDVEYLQALYESYLGRFQADEPRLLWFKEQMRELATKCVRPVKPAELYRGVRGAGRLSAVALNRLRLLCHERYLYAKDHDVALNRVITGSALTKLAREKPKSLQGLLDCGVKPGAVRQYGKIILGWLGQARLLQEDAAILPPFDAMSHNRELEKSYSLLKNLIQRRCKEHGICPELLCRGQLLDDYFLSKERREIAQLQSGWRLQCLGELDI